MIAKLTGIVDTIYESKIILDVGGVGYEVAVPAGAMEAIRPGERASLFIYESVPQDSAPVLYGFAAREDKELFLLLTTVQGVGPKAAMSILSVGPSDRIAGAIIAGDAAFIAQANGVGAKTSARVVAELADKVAKIGVASALGDIAAATATAGGSSVAADAISALVNLGYSRTETAAAVGAVISAEPDLSVGEAIRKALARFS